MCTFDLTHCPCNINGTNLRLSQHWQIARYHTPTTTKALDLAPSQPSGILVQVWTCVRLSSQVSNEDPS